MTERRTKPPAWLQDYVTEPFLTARINELERVASEKEAKEQELRRRARFPGAKRKATSSTPATEVAIAITKPTMSMKPNPPQSLKSPPSQENVINLQPSKSVENGRGQLDSWTQQVAQKVNEISGTTPAPESAIAKQTVTLSPAMISETVGVQFMTQIIGARDNRGEIQIPKLLQLGKIQPLRTSPLGESDGSGVSRFQEIQDEPNPSSSITQPIDIEGTWNTREKNSEELPLYEQASEIENESNENNARDPTSLTNPAREVPANRTATTTSTTTTPMNPSNPYQTSGINNYRKRKLPVTLDLLYNPQQPSFYSGLDLKRFKRTNEVLSRHKPFRYNFTRNPIIAPGLNTHLYADTIAAYKNYGDVNSGYKYILVLQDGLSKMAYTKKLKQADSYSVAKALDQMFMRLDLPGHTFFCTDQGKEFLGPVSGVLDKYSMTRLFLTNRHKASVVERFK